ncbi:MAG: hypothetical protein ACOH19_05835 [Rhodoglobus sp.]
MTADLQKAGEMMFGRIARSSALAVIVGILSVGCVTSAPNQHKSPMDHLAAKAQLVALLEVAQESIGGEWERSDAGARDCVIEGGASGANYALNRYGPGVATDLQQPIVDAVIEAWAQQGVDAVVTTMPEVNDVVVTQLRYPEVGLDAGGFYVEVWISDRAAAAGGQTRCATGDAAEINAP